MTIATLSVGVLAFALVLFPALARQKETVDYLVRENLSGVRGGNLVASVSADPATFNRILFGNTPSDVVPDLQTTVWCSGGANHFWFPNQTKPATRWEEQIDSLTTSPIQSLDDAVRRKASFQVQEIWMREMPAIATVAPNILSGWRNAVGNIQPSILIPYLLWNVEELTKRTR